EKITLSLPLLKTTPSPAFGDHLFKEGNIAFVKTHKTGSTSMAAILYRYAVRHGLKVCVGSSLL
ncbi:unnamed protein product, partial [Scytosiphon promiscuus]